MGIRLLICAVLAAGIMSADPPATAETVTSHDLAETVLQEGNTTYLDLARHFVPDLADAGGKYVGKTHIAVRHIRGGTSDDTLVDEPGLSRVNTLALPSSGKYQRMLVLFDFSQNTPGGESLSVLALYDIGAEPKLLDAVNISFDTMTSLLEEPLLRVGKNAAILQSHSSHFNAGQSYDIRLLTLVYDDKLALVDTAMLFGELYCNMDRQQTMTIRTGKDEGKALLPVKLKVIDIAKPTEDACDDGTPKSYGTKTYSVTYHWNDRAGQYEADSRVLETLAKENEQRF